MKWMLVVMLVHLAPMKTELLYDSLAECLRAEQSVREEWAKVYNAASSETREFIQKQITHGTCIPHAPARP